MFDNYIALECDVCKKTFTGRQPVEGGAIICPECLIGNILPVMNKGDELPESVNAEFENGRGTDE